MQITMTFAGGKKESIKLRNFNAKLNGNMIVGLRNIGVIMERALKKKLGGESSTKFFAPGGTELRSRTGMLRRSINFQMGNAGYGPFVRIGPDVVYAAIQEFGGKINVTDKMRRTLHYKGVHLRKRTTQIDIPARPWFFRTYRERKPEIIRAIEKAIYRPIRRL